MAIHSGRTVMPPSCASSRRAASSGACACSTAHRHGRELLAFHSRPYLEFVRQRSQSGCGFLDAGDTPAFRGVYEAAACVVGATLSAMEAIMQGECRRAFVPIADCTTPPAIAPPASACSTTAAWHRVAEACGTEARRLRRHRRASRRRRVLRLREDAAVVSPDLHEDGRYLYPGTGALEERGRGRRAAPS